MKRVLGKQPGAVRGKSVVSCEIIYVPHAIAEERVYCPTKSHDRVIRQETPAGSAPTITSEVY